MSAERLDTTFGIDGHAKLPDYLTLNGMLATHGSIYVDAYNYKKDRRLIYKYTDAGVMDMSWGSGGYIVPHAVTSTKDAAGQNNPVTMVYDPRTKGLIVGFADGDVVDFERRNADGSFDTSWGTGGMLEYRLHGTTITLNQITPLAGKQSLVAFQTYDDSSKAVGGTTQTAGAYSVSLLRLDRQGRFDKTFAGDGVANVQLGTLKSLNTPDSDPDSGGTSAASSSETGTLAEDLDEPIFGDIQVLSDGGYRLITTRDQSTSVTHYDHGFDAEIDNTKTGRLVASTWSINVSVAGAVSVQQTYTLHREQFRNVQADVQLYTPELALAEGSDCVTVLAETDDGGGTSVLRLTPTSRSATAPLPSAGPYLFGIFNNNPGGKIFVETTGGNGFPTVGLYNHDLTLDTGFATNGTYNESTGYILHAGDDESRLVVANYGTNDLRRLI